MRRRGQSFRGEVRQIMSDIREQEAKRLTSVYENTLLRRLKPNSKSES